MSSRYEQRQQNRKDRLERAADRAAGESNRRYARAHDSIAGIPPGQPILVGHHSEGRHRAALRRHDDNMRKAIDEGERAKDYASRAAAVGTGGISSDDPEAVVKLRRRIEGEEATLEAIKAVAAALRKAKIRVDAEDGAARVAAVIREHAQGEDLQKSIAQTVAVQARMYHNQELFKMPGYATTNLSANIRRLKQRLEVLEKQAEVVSAHEEAGVTERTIYTGRGFHIVEDYDWNRVRIHFDAKPEREVCERLRHSYGFIWARHNKAWVRKLYAGRAPYQATAAREYLERLPAYEPPPAVDCAGCGVKVRIADGGDGSAAVEASTGAPHACRDAGAEELMPFEPARDGDDAPAADWTQFYGREEIEELTRGVGLDEVCPDGDDCADPKCCALRAYIRERDATP